MQKVNDCTEIDEKNRKIETEYQHRKDRSTLSSGGPSAHQRRIAGARQRDDKRRSTTANVETRWVRCRHRTACKRVGTAREFARQPDQERARKT
jgi:hypothetical protein